MTSKQRAFLRGMANSYEPILIIGKDGLTENIIKQADDALAARELIKIKCLESAMQPVREVATQIAEGTGAEVVQVIGSKAVLYRPAKKPVIELPR